MDKLNQSGHLKIDDKDIVYSVDGKECWRIPAIKICAMGEYTTSAGPFEDDFFLVFVIEGGAWYEASFYARERDTFLSNLEKFFGDELKPGLCNSTEWNSRVVWPKELEGKELFVRDSKRRLFGKKTTLSLSPAVLKLAKDTAG